ncbi:MAG: RnfABCDGE type electron transport complex subunit D [Clostridiales bacterium]|nr:RnfABCDGE type electron transport complex subunit D [Clostridiales bacterium]
MATDRAAMPQEVKDTRKYSLGTLLMLAPLVVMSTYYYGERALRMTLISALTAVIAEYVGSVFVRKKATLADLNALCIGVMIPLLLPASSPLWLPLVGVVFAIVAVKLPFGNARSNMFEPVSAAIAFLTICSKAYMFGYPKVGVITYQSTILQPDYVAGTSLASMLYQSNSIGTNLISMLDLWIGSFVGPMGATCGFAFLAIIISMFFSRRDELWATGSFILTAALYAFLFPRVLTGRIVSVAMELSAGMLVFAAIFLITNPAILPKTRNGKIFFGVFAALLTMLMRSFGVFEEGVCFAVLITNALSEQFDKIRIPSFRRRQPEKAPLSDEEFERITDASFIDVGEAPSAGGVGNE